MGRSLLSQAATDRMRGRGLNLCQGRFRLDIIRNFSTERVVSCPGRWRAEMFRKTVDVALNTILYKVFNQWSDSISQVFPNLTDSAIL